MAELLHGLGTLAARRAWAVVIAWIVLLGVAVGGFLVGFGGLTANFDIPDTDSGRVIARLEEKVPRFAGASGTVVFRTSDGSAFTDAQRGAISAIVANAQDLPDVATVVDPFAAETLRSQQQEQVDSGRAQIEGGRGQIEAGLAQVQDGLGQLDAQQQQLDAARQQAEAAGLAAEQLDAQQQQLDAQRTQLEQQRRQLTDSLAVLDEQSVALELGAELLALSEGIRVVAENGSTALVNVAFTEPRLELADASKQAVMEYFESTPVDGVEVVFSTEISQTVPEVVGIGEAIGVAVAGVVLLIVLGSWLAAAFPIVTAILGVALGALATLAFSGVVQMASVTPVLGVMLGLAVGIDYALFIINRHRVQLLRGAEVHESIGLATGTAGNAVVFAGSTVVVALLALNVTGIPFLGLMGTVGAVSVALAVLIAISLTPALLGLAGVRVLGKRDRARLDDTDAGAALPARPMSMARAVATVLASVATLLTIALPALSMRLGLPDGGSEPPGSTAYQAFAIIEEEFGEGANGPLLVTASLPEGLSGEETQQVQAALARELAAQDAVVAVAPVAVSDDGLMAVFQVVPLEGPNSVTTENLVRDLRALPAIGGDVTLGVAGQAAINIDISEGLADVLPLYLAVVVGLSFLIMMMVFRSVLVPLIASGGFVLSLFATYGVVTAIFQWGWLGEVFAVHSPGPILSFLPVILVGILFGLAMDYQLFLTSGMREAYVHGSPARLAVTQGFRAGRRVVTAAAAIMVAVFAGFISSESGIIKSLGVGLAVGVLLDAVVVRMLLMPALMHLLGRSAWWMPRWLDRITPDVDVEGAALERRHRLH